MSETREEALERDAVMVGCVCHEWPDAGGGQRNCPVCELVASHRRLRAAPSPASRQDEALEALERIVTLAHYYANEYSSRAQVNWLEEGIAIVRAALRSLDAPREAVWWELSGRSASDYSFSWHARLVDAMAFAVDQKLTEYTVRPLGYLDGEGA